MASLLASVYHFIFSHIPATFRGSGHFYRLPNRRPTTQDYDYRILCEFFVGQVDFFYVNFLQVSHDAAIYKRLKLARCPFFRRFCEIFHRFWLENFIPKRLKIFLLKIFGQNFCKNLLIFFKICEKFF